jgi:hypothetical protein
MPVVVVVVHTAEQEALQVVVLAVAETELK